MRTPEERACYEQEKDALHERLLRETQFAAHHARKVNPTNVAPYLSAPRGPAPVHLPSANPNLLESAQHLAPAGVHNRQLQHRPPHTQSDWLLTCVAPSHWPAAPPFKLKGPTSSTNMVVP